MPHQEAEASDQFSLFRGVFQLPNLLPDCCAWLASFVRLRQTGLVRMIDRFDPGNRSNVDFDRGKIH
jgi:hypothetical protein